MTPEQTAEMITRDYKDHVAEYTRIDAADTPGPGMEFLIWHKPGTCVGYVSYIAIGNSLIVRGDYGEAIYMVTDHQPLRFWENTGISYFKEKCRASEGGYGSKWNDWSEEECHQRIDEAVLEHYDEEEPSDEVKELVIDLKNAACTKQDYDMYILRHDDDLEKIFGDYWQDYSPWDWGNVYPVRLHCHHIGLKLAFKQLREKGVVE